MSLYCSVTSLVLSDLLTTFPADSTPFKNSSNRSLGTRTVRSAQRIIGLPCQSNWLPETFSFSIYPPNCLICVFKAVINCSNCSVSTSMLAVLISFRPVSTVAIFSVPDAVPAAVSTKADAPSPDISPFSFSTSMAAAAVSMIYPLLMLFLEPLAAPHPEMTATTPAIAIPRQYFLIIFLLPCLMFSRNLFSFQKIIWFFTTLPSLYFQYIRFLPVKPIFSLNFVQRFSCRQCNNLSNTLMILLSISCLLLTCPIKKTYMSYLKKTIFTSRVLLYNHIHT